MKLPSIRYTNMRREFPNSQCYDTWRPHFDRYWSGKLWIFEIHGHSITLDFRGGPEAVFRDLIDPR